MVSIPIITIVLEGLLCVMDYEFVVFFFKTLPFLDSLIILSSVCFYGVLAFFLMLRISFLSCFALGREELFWISYYNSEIARRHPAGLMCISQGSDNTIVLPTDSM